MIEAARDILFAHGYSGATMQAIRKAAEMRVGAIQHQFPTKAKIMAAVVGQFSAHRMRIYAEAIRRGTTPRESMENLIDANFQMLRGPEMAAALEFHLARRNDLELEHEVGPSARRFDRRVRLWVHVKQTLNETDPDLNILPRGASNPSIAGSGLSLAERRSRYSEILGRRFAVGSGRPH